jgi:hypothetical protein
VTLTHARPARTTVVLWVIGAILLGCASLDRPRAQGDTVALPTPIASFDAAISQTVAALEEVVMAVGSRLEVPAGAYRASEPQSLLDVPRAVVRADLADPDEGYVVIYRAADAAGAASLAADLAAYLGTGLGLTNYPADTRFSVAVVGDTVVFTSWSAGRSSDRERGEAVFEALASVGQPVEVVR